VRLFPWLAQKWFTGFSFHARQNPAACLVGV
jgi:hypothetical protein